MPSLALRPYQTDGVHDIREAFGNGHERVLYVLPTGGGKTHLFSYICAGVVTKGKRVIVLVHRDELLRQCSAAFANFGVPHGIVAAGVRGLPRTPAIVASVFTLARRLDHVPPPDLIVCDEAHHVTRSTTFGKVLAAFPEAKVLGVTATPCRLDGTGLGETFSAMVQGPTVAELTEEGYLCPAEIYGPSNPVDLSAVKTRAGDFAIDQVGAAMDRSTVTGDAVEHYGRLADGRAAVAFCCSVAHAYHVAAQFRTAGYRALAVEGKTDIDERRQAIADLASGKLQVLTSAEIVSEGVDVPRIECAVLLRPTQSTGLYLQQVGRSLRPYPGKDATIILDHAGNYMRHGLPDQDRLWTLEGARRGRGKSDAPAIRTCPECFAAHAPAPVCPRCGHVYAVQSRVPDQVEGVLERVNGAGVQLEMPISLQIKRATSREALERLALERGYRPGWVEHVLRSREAKRVRKAMQKERW